MEEQRPIAETPNYIVLDSYTKSTLGQTVATYQSESALEHEFIQDLSNQGYEYLRGSLTHEALMSNVRKQLETLNAVEFSDSEWQRYCIEYLDSPSDSAVDKTRKVQDDYIYDFTFDDGTIRNIYLVDKRHIARNKMQVMHQYEQQGSYLNRYDVTILVNGLPMVQVELKRRGVAIREAFNQVHRYTKESFNTDNSLFRYLQLFVISNGTDTRYFSNTLKRSKSSYEFTMNWAKADNTLIRDLKDFTETFFQKNTLLQILFSYSIFDVTNSLMVMRPYQIAATERIQWKIRSAYLAKHWSNPEGGGYIWHTTGSGKTLTSFKAARLATQLDFIDKVLFVVDRKDLDNQTIKKYEEFSPGSATGSNSTAKLKENLAAKDNKIVVTTIQKLNNLLKKESNLPVYDQHVVMIFDEAHRSQFGEAQKNIRSRFKKYYQFGFTGTPIFPENALGSDTTASVFGQQLHSYVITDAIRDEKVLKFKVDYNNVRPRFRELESEQDIEKLSATESKLMLLHSDRISEISRYILDNFRFKTHRAAGSTKGFNAMFAVDSVQAAKLYYEEFKKLQRGSEDPLKIATIFSFAQNEEQNAKGEIPDESFEPSAMDMSAKEFLAHAIKDYNELFKTNFGLESDQFELYYKNLSERVRDREVDLVIVVGMFLTGFDAPTLNTLFVDKNLRYHGLLQAFSRTNRIYDATKSFGNIVTFRDLEQATIEAITLFGSQNTRNVILERSYKEYMEGFKDILTGKARKGYVEIVGELKERFPDVGAIVDPSHKKEFVKLFGKYLKIENILQNYDEYTQLKELHRLDMGSASVREDFKEKYYLKDTDLNEMMKVDVLSDRQIQDYKSTYNDIREWLKHQIVEPNGKDPKMDWDDVVFEVELLKSQEIDLDYILELVLEHKRKTNNKETLIEEIRRVIRSSVGNRAKESLIVDYINETNLEPLKEKADIIESFFTYAQKRQREEAEDLIRKENLKEDAAKRYIQVSLNREFASMYGTDLQNILPTRSPLSKGFLEMKKRVFERISDFVEKFKGIGGEL